jgi:hypothetical protein
VLLGSNPIGGPLMGWISSAASPRIGLLVGAVAAIAGGLVARVAFVRMPDVATGEHRAVQLHPEEGRRHVTQGKAPAGTRSSRTAARDSHRGPAAAAGGASASRSRSSSPRS